MSTSRRPGGAAAAVVVTAAFMSALVMPTSAVAAQMPDYPTWQDVQNARKSEAATRAEIAQIEGILVQLEAKAAELGKVAQQKAEVAAQAQDALDVATKKLATLKKQAQKAQDSADESAKRATLLIAQLARTGGGDVTLGLMLGGSADDTDKLLSRLGSMSKLSESSAAILQQAIFDRNQAQSLADDANAAEKVRKKLAKAATEAATVAQAASDEAAAEVVAQEAAATQMYAQLATLKGTTAATEAAYQEGLTEAQEAAQSSGPPPSSPPSGVDPTPPAPVQGAVAQAIAYARAQLGEPYAFGGAGPSSWDCSGLTKMSYASAGVYIGTHSVSNQYATMRGQGRLVSIGSLAPGDLLFYSSGGSTSGGFYHVTMYIGGGQMIEAPRPGVSVRIVAVRYGDLVPYAGRPTG
jgi:cell wall-associated NlpC family hydrolase